MFILENMSVTLRELEAMEQAIRDMAWPLEIVVTHRDESMAKIGIEFGSLDMLLSLGLLAGKYTQLSTRVD